MSVDINKLSWGGQALNIKVDHAEWNTLVDSIEEEGYTENKTNLKTVKREFPLGSYRFDDQSRDKSLYLKNWNGNLIHFYTFNDEEKNEPSHVTGWEAFLEIDTRFQSINKVSFSKAFGTWQRGTFDKKEGNYSLYHYELEQCNAALPAIIDCDPFEANKIKHCVYKADISSAYPYELTKPLPTTKDMVGPLKGAILPPKGYVAYWTKSGHVIEYEGVDTRLLADHPLYRHKHKFKTVQNEVTYLLPYSKYNLKPVMEALYSGRAENARNKGVMNSFVGMLRSRKEYQKNYMGHISALVYARHIHYMCEIYDSLIKDNLIPIMYATDSVIWLGGPCSVATKDKYLGSFTLEYEDCRAIYSACGVYALEKDGVLSMVKHQGISDLMWKSKNITSLEDFQKRAAFHMQERYNKKTHRYEVYEKMEIRL